MRNIVTHSRGGLLLVPLLLLFSVCCLLLLVRAGLWNGRGAPFGIAIPGAGLLLFGFATREALSAPSRTTIETDSQERVLRIGCETLVGPIRRVYPYDDICEVCVRPRSGRGGPVAHDLSIFTRAEGWSPPVAFAREAAARHVAGRLAAEIGCLSCAEGFPFDYEMQRLVLIILGTVFFLTVVHPIDQGVAPLAVVGLVLCGLFALWAWLRGPARYVRIDRARRMLGVYHRFGFGAATFRRPFDAIAEIVAEIVTETDDPGERPPSYAVRIVPGDDAPWDAAGESGEPRHDTVFRSTDGRLVRSTAERLARRIGRPWRDATA